MSELSLKGKVKLVGELKTFDSGFTKRELVITTDDKYPQDVVFETYKEKTSELSRFKKGDPVEVSFNVRGNEYNGRHYVSLQAWKIADLREEPQREAQPAEEPEDLPF